MAVNSAAARPRLSRARARSAPARWPIWSAGLPAIPPWRPSNLEFRKTEPGRAQQRDLPPPLRRVGLLQRSGTSATERNAGNARSGKLPTCSRNCGVGKPGLFGVVAANITALARMFGGSRNRIAFGAEETRRHDEDGRTPRRPPAFRAIRSAALRRRRKRRQAQRRFAGRRPAVRSSPDLPPPPPRASRRSASSHHCRRIVPAIGSLTSSLTRPISIAKA